MPKEIKDWNDLAGLESEDYRLDIDLDMGCGYIIPKDEFSDRRQHYLSTHTFYDSRCKGYEDLLQICGFDVILQSWD